MRNEEGRTYDLVSPSQRDGGDSPCTPSHPIGLADLAPKEKNQRGNLSPEHERD